jgi:concanavalin A-like lectin/glucanase superfamily protein/TAT (twin-arginine translocation) pathway-exported protein
MPELSRRTFLQSSAAAAAAVLASDLLPALTPAAQAAGPAWSPPSLDAMAGDWQPVSGIAHQPEISNFWGGLEAAATITGFQRLTMAPYSQAGTAFDLTFDGQALASQYVRWYPYQIHRIAETAAGLRVQSGTRMAFEANQILLTVNVTNPTAAPVSTTATVALNPLIRKFLTGWNWQIPRPNDQNFRAQIVGSAPNRNLLVSDNSGPAVTVVALSPAPQTLSVSGVGGTASWPLTLAAGATTTLNIVIAIGDTSTGRALASPADANAVLSAASTAIGSFSSVFTAAQTGWANRWTDAFSPGNTHYSGSLPVIATDRPAIDRLYYMSVISVLASERTNLGPAFNGFLGRPAGGFSGFNRIYTTGANEFGGTTMFFWDTSYCSVLLALLDPQMLKAITTYFLNTDIHTCYGIDTLTGNKVGNYYSANDLTVSSTAMNYVKLSGDWAYLSSVIGGSSVLQRLTGAATYWRNFVRGGQQLADYGDNINLLEVLSRYTNQVASLNAGNVWLMRQVADLQTRTGNPGQAGPLTTAANSLLPNVLALYVPGQGVWNCRHADGTLVPVRTVVDFCIGSNVLAADLSPTQQNEMKSFVTRELLDGNWMRALSLQDSEAPVGRPDHGSTGAYESWPALTAQTFAKFGDYSSALSQLTTFSGVTSQGPFGQAHQLAPGRSGYRVVDRPALNPTGSITLAAWINASSWPANIWQGSIIAKDSFSANAGYVFRGGAGGLLSFVIYTGGGNWSELATTTPLSAGRHYVVATFTGSAMTIYVDGFQRADKAQTGAIAVSNVDLMVGNCPSDTTRQFSGAIDGAQVYRRGLSAAEVSAAYTAGNPFAGDESALVLHAPMQLGLPNPVPDTAALNPTGALTLAAWINASSWPANIWEGSIIAKDSFGADAGYVLRGGAGGLLSFFLYTGGGNSAQLTTTTPLTGGWHHVAATFSGSAMTIHVDGVQRASRAQTGSIAPSNGVGVMIGNCPSDLTRQFAGAIADARIYRRALSPAEVAAIVAAGNTFAARADPALALWYPPVSGPSAAVPDVGLIANDDPQVYNGTEGGAFAGVIVTDLFGYAPDGQQAALKDAGVARGFTGTLAGVSFNGRSYTITSRSTGLTIA